MNIGVLLPWAHGDCYDCLPEQTGNHHQLQPRPILHSGTITAHSIVGAKDKSPATNIAHVQYKSSPLVERFSRVAIRSVFSYFLEIGEVFRSVETAKSLKVTRILFVAKNRDNNVH